MVISFNIKVILVILELIMLFIINLDFFVIIVVMEVVNFGREVLKVIIVILMIKGEILRERLIFLVEFMN